MPPAPPRITRWRRRLTGALLLLAASASPALASGEQPSGPDPEATREVVGLLLGFLGVTVVVVILLLVLGLPARSWLRQRRGERD